MTIRYAPETLDRLANYKRDLEARVLAGSLTKPEATTLYKAKQDEIFRALDEPRKSVNAVCSECGKTTSTIGATQRFRCPCSPTVERSVWDSRKEAVK